MSLKGRKLTIFGCGYIGRRVALQGLSQGMVVSTVTRNTLMAETLKEDGVQNVICADLESGHWHSQIDTDQDLVLTAVSAGGSGAEGYRQSYVDGQWSVARWSRGGLSGTYIYISSTGVYPQKDGERVDETASLGGATERARVLREAELIAAGVNARRWFVMRFAGIYGPERHHLLNQLKKSTTLAGRGDHTINLIHRDDAAAAIWAAFLSKREISARTYNVSDGHHATKAEVAQWLADRYDLGDVSFDPEKKSVRTMMPSGQVPNRRIMSDRMRKELGWRPEYPTYREGYEQISSYVKKYSIEEL